MESKGTEEKITYPNIYFTVDNFEDVRTAMQAMESLIQYPCVSLFEEIL